MLRSIIQLVLLSMVCCQSAQALSRKYEFPPETPTEIKNPLFWTLDAHCAITTPDSEDRMSGVMLSKNGSINGTKVNEGGRAEMTVHNGDDLHIIADRSARLQIINHGSSTVKAKCSI